MKRIMKLAAAVYIIILGSSLTTPASAQDYDYDDYDNDYRNDREVSYQTFYDELSPHGRWIDYPEYGYVWVPDAGPDFRPYSSNGRWVWTDDYDWMWVSDYDWGWAPFHYGRWSHDPYYGWFWVPGYEWSPAWVAWRDGGDYYGWAPLRPGINISINFNIGGYSPPYDYWSFTPRRYITSRSIFNHCIDYRRNVTIINQTVIINNFNYSRNVFRTGPRRYDAERYCGRIEPIRFRQSFRPGRAQFRNNEVSVYRPQVRRDDDRRFSPRQVERFERRDNNQGENRNNTFRRGNGNNGQNNNEINRNNNQPRREFGRRGNNEMRQPQNNNLPERRNFERREQSNGGQSNGNNERRVFRQPEQGERRFDGNNRNDRQFEPRRNNNGNGNDNNRRPERRVENNNSPVRQPQMRNNNDMPQRQPRQYTEQRRQEQPRQFERRSDNGGRQQGNSDGSNRRGNGRGRF